MPGNSVTRLGITYVATQANQNSPPEWTPTHWSATSTAWVQGKYYAAGSVVSYKGALYTAKYANPGYNPTISTYYWAPYSF